ncbi:uncharacterized protein BO72DRAFT_491746 [Aspergillus fijiensis CBS 313.89]|uniref:Uncharacterized protein n=1 Tax=Aspergillus fijiensis CBS 313.89 TaxID=1448319 RepID=A0A8G1RZY7_9EURO|nr:uncharacterized protein BO72DRAFT_491746 [Aspergillus fijiensis CBS 313.89]RAK82123.1 hypothetical protein BO72DRAFT_491746 [Aspergillus fijiensis CBS 313.89]
MFEFLTASISNFNPIYVFMIITFSITFIIATTVTTQARPSEWTSYPPFIDTAEELNRTNASDIERVQLEGNIDWSLCYGDGGQGLATAATDDAPIPLPHVRSACEPVIIVLYKRGPNECTPSLVDNALEDVVVALMRAAAAGEADEAERLAEYYKADHAGDAPHASYVSPAAAAPDVQPEARRRPRKNCGTEPSRVSDRSNKSVAYEWPGFEGVFQSHSATPTHVSEVLIPKTYVATKASP